MYRCADCGHFLKALKIRRALRDNERMRTQLQRFQEALKTHEIDGAVIAAPEALSSVNLRYLSGFTGSSAFLLITPHQAWILTDFRYVEQVRKEAPDFELVRHKPNVSESIADLCAAHGIKRLGFEADKLPVTMWQAWTDAVPVTWAPLNGMVEALRLIKTPEEILEIRTAARVAGEALMVTLPGMVGKRELDVALELEWAMRQGGADAVAFSTIVASGERGSMPHGRASERVIQPGELVTIDFGARLHGYHSDETVTVATGPVSDELAHIFAVVAAAQTAGIAVVRAGAKSHEVDAAARAVIDQAGYSEYFGHGTGHGIGLDVHEAPYAHPFRTGTDQVLESGMTITVEPGIYLPGIGGVRIEDTLVVTEGGAERLTTVPKEFRMV